MASVSVPPAATAGQAGHSHGRVPERPLEPNSSGDRRVVVFVGLFQVGHRKALVPAGNPSSSDSVWLLSPKSTRPPGLEATRPSSVVSAILAPPAQLTLTWQPGAMARTRELDSQARVYTALLSCPSTVLESLLCAFSNLRTSGENRYSGPRGASHPSSDVDPHFEILFNLPDLLLLGGG